jgi:hypothetical protein
MVSECRYNNTHTTPGHKCGRCGYFGHGLLECRSLIKRDKLRPYLNDIIGGEERCTIIDCVRAMYHTVDAHHCDICKDRVKHSLFECPKRIKKINCPICRTENILSNNPKKIYGLTDKCSICLDNPVEILFETCSHCCVCNDCFMKL